MSAPITWLDLALAAGISSVLVVGIALVVWACVRGEEGEP
jgi:hypothetical protein